jgi:hypothetical protein
LLYSPAGLSATTGSIRGRVSADGGPVNLASVVALSQDGIVVSALANPDGTYEITGIPAGSSYYVYAHPLPPAVLGEAYNAGITPPVLPDGTFLTVNGSFETQFYPGTKNPAAAQALVVTAGTTLENINFNVQSRTAPAIFGVQTFSFPGQVAVKPAHLSPEAARSFILAAGYGLTERATVGVLGGSAVIPQGGVRPYGPDPRYLQIDTQFNLGSGEGPRHLTFAMDGDLYVLPSAFRLTRRLAPQISALVPSFDATGGRLMQISGSGLSLETRILFDGIPAIVRSFDGAMLTVAPPPLAGGQRSVVVALNPDGQSSLFLQANAPPTADPDSSDFSGITISPSQLPAGVDTAIEITGVNTVFNPSYVAVALGSAGITVKDVWVTGSDRILANVSVSASAVPGSATVTVLNGVRMLSIPFGVQVAPPNPRQSFLRTAGTLEFAAVRTGVSAGGSATVQVTGPLAEQPAAALRVTVADQAATIVSYNGGLLVFRIPATIAPGPAIVRVSSNSDSALPMVLTVDPQPPIIEQVQVSGTRVDANRPVQPGELVSLIVTGLGDTSAEPLSRIAVIVAAFSQRVTSVNPLNGRHVVQFVLDAGIPAGPQVVSVSIDGRSSEPVSLPVRRN